MSVYDYVLRVLVVGDTGVGKTSLCQRLSLSHTIVEPAPTIGVDFFSCTVKDNDHSSLKCHIWDIAGAKLYRLITDDYFRDIAVACIVFDLSCHSSFQSVPDWLKKIRNSEGCCSPLLIILIGNKSDKTRRVSSQEAKEYTSKEGIAYMETCVIRTSPIEEFTRHIIRLREHETIMKGHPGCRRFPHRDPYASLDTQRASRENFSIKFQPCWRQCCGIL